MKKSLLLLLLPVFLVGIFAFAQNNGTGNSQDNSNKSNDVHSTVMHSTGTTSLSTDAITCISNALTKRDTTIAGGMTTYNASWTAAFNARTAALIASLSISNQKDMKTAWNTALKTNEKAINAAEKTKKTTIQAAWNGYRTDLKACNIPMARVLMQERGGNDLTH